MQASTTPEESRSFEFSYVLHVPAAPAGSDDIQIWLPIPPTDLHQTVTRMRIEAPVAYHLTRDIVYNNPMAFLEADPSTVKTPFDVRVSFHVQRMAHRVALAATNVDLPDQALPVSPRLLEADRLVPIDHQIAAIEAQETRFAYMGLDKARALYGFVAGTIHDDGDGVASANDGDALRALRDKHGDSADLESLLTGMARAAGIPARMAVGYRIPAGEPQGSVSKLHCWSEMMVTGIGWIPMDAAQGSEGKTSGVKGAENRFFGAVDSNRILIAVGRDIRLKPAQAGAALNYFDRPYAEVDGKALVGLKSEFSFREDGATAHAASRNQQ